jgi:hypothetical protein
LKRQPIVDQINTLTIHRVHIRPYIVCVSFYKNDLGYNVMAQNSSGSAAETVDRDQYISSLSCSGYNKMLLEDERIHDVDLCVDVDIHDHFLR